MRLIDIITNFVGDLKAQRLRTTLTILGITWGTVAVVVLLAFGVGLERQTRENMSGMGDGIVVMFGGQTTKAFEGFGEGRPIRLREQDVTMIAREIPGAGEISPEYRSGNVVARVGTRMTSPVTTGVYPIYAGMRNIFPEHGGRFINQLDMDLRRRVIFLGDEIKRALFGEEDAIGKEVFLGQTPFKVIGVMQSKVQNSSYAARDQDRVFIPASTYHSLFGDLYLANIIYRPADAALSGDVGEQVRQLMAQRYRFDPTDRSAVNMWDTTEMNEFLRYFFLGFNIFMGIVGSFTLVVGGIGVANIMYVVVKERTREIGVRRSVGARKIHIMSQFFLEAFLIVAFGAVVGLVLSFAIIKLVAMVPIQEYVGSPTVSMSVALITMGILALIAFIAGLFPARKAANLDPVEALRY